MVLWLRLHRSFFSPDAEALLPLRLAGRPGSLDGERRWSPPTPPPAASGLPAQPCEPLHGEIGVHGEVGVQPPPRSSNPACARDPKGSLLLFPIISGV